MHVWLPKGYPQPETMLTSLEHTYGSLRDIYYPPPSHISPDAPPSHDTNDNGQGLGPGLGLGTGDSRIDDDYAQAPGLEAWTVEPLVAMTTQGWTDRQQYLFKQAQAARYLEGGDLHATLARKSSNLAYSQNSLQGARTLKVIASSSLITSYHTCSSPTHPIISPHIISALRTPSSHTPSSHPHSPHTPSSHPPLIYHGPSRDVSRR